MFNTKHRPLCVPTIKIKTTTTKNFSRFKFYFSLFSYKNEQGYEKENAANKKKMTEMKEIIQ